MDVYLVKKTAFQIDPYSQKPISAFDKETAYFSLYSSATEDAHFIRVEVLNPQTNKFKDVRVTSINYTPTTNSSALEIFNAIYQNIDRANVKGEELHIITLDFSSP